MAALHAHPALPANLFVEAIPAFRIKLGEDQAEIEKAPDLGTWIRTDRRALAGEAHPGVAVGWARPGILRTGGGEKRLEVGADSGEHAVGFGTVLLVEAGTEHVADELIPRAGAVGAGGLGLHDGEPGLHVEHGVEVGEIGGRAGRGRGRQDSVQRAAREREIHGYVGSRRGGRQEARAPEGEREQGEEMAHGDQKRARALSSKLRGSARRWRTPP